MHRPKQAWPLVMLLGCGANTGSGPTSGGTDNTGGDATTTSTRSDDAGDSQDTSHASTQPSTPTTDAEGTGGPTTHADATDGTDATDVPPADCGLTPDRIRVREVDVGGVVLSDEDEVALHPIAISPMPGGGARLAWMGDDGQVHVASVDADDQLRGGSIALPAHDFAALHADDGGGVVLLTRPSTGGGTLNCGQPTNLCGAPPEPAVPCFDMVLVRFDGGTETWATRLTDASPELPPYSTGPDGPDVVFIWWYAHHGRIAFDGQRYAAYFGAAISASEGGCINIHQGDRMRIVGSDGGLQDGGFGWGCSHSGYERVVWHPDAGQFVAVCKTDNDNRIAFAPDYRTIRPVDLWYANLGELVPTADAATWMVTSDLRPGQPAQAEGPADVHLLRARDGLADLDLTLAVDPAHNARAPHLAAYGDQRLVVAWETTPSAGDIARDDPQRQLFVQTRSRSTGEAEGEPVALGVPGNRYHELVSFPDGSVAFTAPGSSTTSIKIARVLPCGG